MGKIVVSLLLVLVLVGGASGAPDVEFSVEFYCGWDGYYRPMEWTPVEIRVQSDLSEPFGGAVLLSAPQDGLNTLNIIHSFVLTPDSPQNLPLVTKFAFGTGRCNLEILDQHGRRQFEQTIDMWDYTAANRLLQPIQENDLLVGVIGQSRFGLLRMPRETACMSERGQGRVCIGRKMPRMVPWDWTGFASLDVLLLYDPDWTLLRSEQMQAMAEWVSKGGTLLVVLGQHPLPDDSPLAAMLPFETGQLRQVGVASGVLNQWGFDVSEAPVGESVTAWPLFARPDASLVESVKAGDNGYVYGLAYSGFGRVAVLAFDPAELNQTHMARASHFWARQLEKALGDEPGGTEPGEPQTRGNGITSPRGRTIVVLPEDEDENEQAGRRDNRYQISIAQKASNQVMEYLYRLAEMRPLSIWWVILTLTALAIILGPLDYLVLKRLDRLPCTWLTSTAWIVLFTVGAYYGVQALRGGRLQLRAVSVLDGIAGSDCAWGTYYTGIYSPRSADYQLEGTGARQWWSGVAPSEDQIWAHQQNSALRQIRCVQEEGTNLPISVPINIWTVQSLLTESVLEGLPLTVNLERADNRCVVELTNASDHAIRTGYVLLKDAYVSLGRVGARATERFEVRTRPYNPWKIEQPRNVYRGRTIEGQSRRVPHYPASFEGVGTDAFLAQGCFDRTLAMHAYLEQGAALVCVEFAEAPAPVRIRDRSYEIKHVQLARMIVFPKDGS